MSKTNLFHPKWHLYLQTSFIEFLPRLTMVLRVSEQESTSSGTLVELSVSVRLSLI